MAWAKNKTVETITVDELLELQERADIVDKLSPEKLVLIAGPTFGTVLKFLLLGMALGAAGAILLREKAASETTSTPATGSDKSTSSSRAHAGFSRAKGLASRARDAAQIVADAARPSLQEAINQAKATAAKTQRELESDISKEEA